jgi:hypothetical protein
MRRAEKPDAQGFDEIRLVTIPRYKTSELSGDEWRISVHYQFYRKGALVHASGGFRNMETAVAFAGAEYYRAIDDGKAYFAGEGDRCDQEGCSEPATVTYKLKKQYCRQGHETDPYEFSPEPLIRRFCDRHSTRGDCGLDDADRNYEQLDGAPAEPQPQDVRPSIFGGVIPLNPQDGN